MRYYLFNLFFFIAFCSICQEQTDIGMALKTGNSTQLSTFFKESIDLDIPNSKGVYNKKQATIILNQFFTNYPPIKYVLKHQGGGNNKSMFEIGSLITEKNKYRTYLLYNLVGKIPQIIELRIELEE